MKKKYLLLAVVTLLLAGCANGQDSSSEEHSNNPSSNETTSESTSVESTTSESSSSSSEEDSSSSSSSEEDSSSSSENESSSSSSSSSSSDSHEGGSTVSTNLYKATIDNNTPEDYYESVRGLKGAELKKGLHEIIKGHDWFNYSDTQEFYKDVDRDPNDPSKMYFIYTGLINVGAGYNKEHVWAKSHGGFKNRYPMHSDMHNLHPCNSNLNSTRGSLDFGEGGELLSQYPGNNRRGNTFEPSDMSKGDTARTIFYMATRYEGEGNEMDLEVSGNIGSDYYDFTSGADGVHGNFEYLYKWATSGQDPVDNYEVSRNNKIYSKYQHNRNPFIDHPEFIQMIYDKNYNGSGALNDANPHHVMTPQEEADEFTKLVDAIDETDINSKSNIEKAGDYYENMTAEAKALVTTKYEEFVAKKTNYNDMSKSYWANKVIKMIDNLGEITLESRTDIEKAEKAYLDLSEEAKALVTNYQELVDARTRLDVLQKEWDEAHPSQPFVFDFVSNPLKTSSYETNVTITDGDRSFLASIFFKHDNDVRLGNNGSCDVDEKFKSAISTLKGDSVSLESLFDISGSKIILKTNGSYKRVDHIYLLKSVDGGTTYTLVGQKDYFDGVKSYEFDIDSSNARYAFVIDGNTPRLKIGSIEVK